MTKNNFLYKKIIFNLGKFFDKFFFTNFYEKSTNYYHQYHSNDYEFPKNKIAFIHAPKIGGLTTYSNDFINNYLFPIIYPESLTSDIQIYLGITLIIINILIYGLIFKNLKKN